ncbi:flagellar biosynthetic protein FliO [Marinimicrobium sp. C2-29]|uniref:flagellar biosynthetic protein FliO n=1 Tax=Marinimicrobium sp. C2-29 TaxID=3139825 RepID=UPI003139B124
MLTALTRFSVVLLTLPLFAWAQSESAPEASEPERVGAASQLLNVALSLLLILALIFALAWLLRRFGQGGFGQRGDMKIVATLPLGTRERLLVVDVGGQQLLLGATPQQIRTLHVFETPVIDTSDTAHPADFKQKLMAIMQHKNSGGR